MLNYSFYFFLWGLGGGLLENDLYDIQVVLPELAVLRSHNVKIMILTLETMMMNNVMHEKT